MWNRSTDSFDTYDMLWQNRCRENFQIQMYGNFMPRVQLRLMGITCKFQLDKVDFLLRPLLCPKYVRLLIFRFLYWLPESYKKRERNDISRQGLLQMYKWKTQGHPLPTPVNQSNLPDRFVKYDCKDYWNKDIVLTFHSYTWCLYFVINVWTTWNNVKTFLLMGRK